MQAASAKSGPAAEPSANERDYLCPNLRAIADLCGVKAALKLSEAWPGVRLFVPQTMTPDHPIALAIGVTAAEKLAQRHGGETISVSSADRYHRQRRNQLILAEYKAGASGRSLALKYGLVEKYVYDLVGKELSKQQADLFEPQ